jgi:peptidylprolyl isomerase
VRSSLALIATAGLVAVALTGCANAAAPDASPGQSSEAVVVKGDFGDEPRVEFPTPLVPEETQCTEVIAGEGEYLTADQFVLLGASLFNGTTGEEVQTVGYGDDGPAPLAVSQAQPAFQKGLTCAREGSRVVVVGPSQDLGGQEGGESAVAVFDVFKAFPARADGSPRLSRDGFPAVVLAPDGRPGITIPNNDPPVKETSEVEVLKQGSGQTVEDGDTVVVQYTGVIWDDSRTVFDSTWEKGAPTTFVVSEGSGSQVIPGFSKAIIGQQVGSQVGVVVPPSDGYGDQDVQNIPANSTLFFVIDILGVI